MYEYLIFDVDGTLIDSETANLLALQQVLREHKQRAYDLADLKIVNGVPGERGLALLGYEGESELLRIWSQTVLQYIDRIALYPHIPELLQTLQKQQIPLGVVTSRTRREWQADPRLPALANHFAHIVCADATEQHKPHPAPLLHYLALAGIKPEQALYIGDTEYDYHCAAGAGIDFALASWGGSLKPGMKPRHILQTPQELLTLVKSAAR